MHCADLCAVDTILSDLRICLLDGPVFVKISHNFCSIRSPATIDQSFMIFYILIIFFLDAMTNPMRREEVSILVKEPIDYASAVICTPASGKNRSMIKNETHSHNHLPIHKFYIFESRRLNASFFLMSI